MQLNYDFYKNKTTQQLAKELLGKVLVVNLSQEILKGVIVETEAYVQEDQASHSYCGKTKRNAVMFEKPGMLYVYQIYGLHYCINVVSEEEGRGCAVLVRRVVPVRGGEVMRENRGDKKELANGPAKLTQAFGLDKRYNGYDLCGKNSNIYIEDMGYNISKLSQTSRVGISKEKDKLWRYVGKIKE